MVVKGWPLLLLIKTAGFVVYAQDATGTCNTALGLSSGAVADSAISSPLGEDTTPASGRLNNDKGAWCFSTDAIASHNAIFIVDLGKKIFVSGFAAQGPPVTVYPETYNHVVGFQTEFSLDNKLWDVFNGGNLFFDTDKDETVDVASYHVNDVVELTQYVKINVTMLVSGSTTVCLRFEIFGCDTNIMPTTGVQALTTPTGKIEVNWMKPSVITSLESNSVSIGFLTPHGYAVRYKPAQVEVFSSVTTMDRMVSLEDVRLGATYVIQLQCIYKAIVINCGSSEIEAYPPCPDVFTGGNEYHCFLYLSPVASFLEARTKCLNSGFDQQLGGLGYLVDEEERKFLVSRILPKDSSELYLVGNLCQDIENCCRLLRIKDGTLEDSVCTEGALTSALCLRDHKGEGARHRVSSVQASVDGSTALFTWRYEGIGWKTDELQVKMWSANEENNPSTFTFSTLSNTFEVKASAGVMYSLLLRPAPNIRTEEFVYKFIIIDFQEGSVKYGAVLTPVPMSIYIIWSGSIRVTWDEAKALSKSGPEWLSEKYSITHQREAESSIPAEVEVASGREFILTPIAMSSTYVFKMSCFFVGVFHPCGEISIKTDPPDLVLPKASKVYVIYEMITDKMKTWSEAEDDCQQRAGHLTSLLDDEEAKALLKMFPSADYKIWTGAKLEKKGSGYWTDGQKITDLPMAKNSGVTSSSSESCCRAINELGKLKLAGSNCEEKNPYICKYSVEEIMTVPSDLMVSEIKWHFFKIAWSKPDKRWLPTFYNVRACLKVSRSNCVVKNNVEDGWQLDFGSLLQLQTYEVEIEAVLQPVDIKTVSQISVMTYPKSPVRVSISPLGESYVSSPMLVAKGFPSATVTATLYQIDVAVETFTGGVTDMPISGLVPEETYKLVVKQDGGDWTHEMSFAAEPTCFGMDAVLESTCFTFVEEPMDFNQASKKCSEESSDKKDPSLWLPLSDVELKNITVTIGAYSNSWIKKPKDGTISNIGSDTSCTKGGTDCCFYDITSSSVLCSSCCEQKRTFICSYKIKEPYLGYVSSLLPDSQGNTSISVQWLPPEDLSWSIRSFEVEWVDYEKSVPLGKDVVVGAVDKLIEGLEYGTDYEIGVTPLGALQARGETRQIRISTLDPRTPLVVTVDSDGGAKVYSPLLMEKGREADQVDLKLFKIEKQDGRKTLQKTFDGQVKGVDVTGLEIGKQYSVEMTPKVKNKPFNYSTNFLAYPSCKKNQIQEGMICVWAPPETRRQSEAYEVCRSEGGDLLDYKTQMAFSRDVKNQLTTYIESRFWVDMGTEGSAAALRDADSSNCPPGERYEVMCCTYELEEKELKELVCVCCDEPRPFACKKVAKITLGDIGNIVLEDVTTTSATISWSLASESKWEKPSFIITWSDAKSRKRRAVADSVNQLVTKDTKASVNDLKPGTEYNVAVAPYTEAVQSSDGSKEIKIVTGEDVNAAGWMDAVCTITILKISCCVSVILGSALTVFVFIATRMFYLDSLAQIFAELATLGAYICILVSSAQSYNDDNECVRAHPTLCVAVSVLIQFFFQVTFLFTFMESLLMCSVLKDYLPQCCTFRSLLGMSISGFGIPAVMMIVLAAVASDGFSDNDNCWLNLSGSAMLPSVIPVIIFGSIAFILVLSIFDVDEPKVDLPHELRMRGRIFLRTRYGCFLILLLTTVCYATGMIGANNRDVALNYVFCGFSIALGVLMPIIRIKFDAEVGEQLKRGLFTSLKDDFGHIRVSPAPNPLINMPEFETRKYKQLQLDELRAKESSLNDSDAVWHR